MTQGGPTGQRVAVRVAVLGPLQLVVAGQVVPVPGPKRRAVLALLARAHGRVVSVDELLSAVWPAEAADRAIVHVHISRLRGHLGGAATRLETVDDGYRLRLDDGELDVAVARGLLRRAREQAGGEPGAALELLRQARALWRGAVLPDLTEVAPLAAWTVALDELRREIEDQYLACALAAGQADEVVGPARESVAADPLREQAVLLLMRALHGTGRTAEALREGYAYRRRVSHEAGLDPSPALADLERELAAVTPAPTAGPGTGTALLRLVGREAELAALRRLLAHERLVTVVGPGGVGKTSLALALTRQSARCAVLLLAPVRDPAAVPFALATALDLRVVQGDVVAACAALLGAGPWLLLVDNCEHLRAAAGELIGRLLASCPQLTVLATAREPLGLPAERQLRLEPLALPGPQHSGSLANAPAVTVFLDRARRVRDSFAPTGDDLRMVADLVRRLDGLPLAIELAAGRLSSMSVADLHTRLDRALDLLGGSPGSADPRHQTLRATIDWSYQLLAPAEQRLFRQLAVFPDGFDLATVEWVAGELGLTGDPAGVLARLVDASMVEAHLDGDPRYRMLDTLRAFALAALTAAGETATAQDRLVRWAVRLARWVGATEVTEREPEADATLRRELGNLRAAWKLVRQAGRLDDAIMLVAGLLETVATRDITEVWGWAGELAGDAAAASHPDRAAVLGMAATVAWQRGELATALELGQRGLAVAGEDQGRWWCLSALANASISSGQFREAIRYATEAAQLRPVSTENYAIAALAALYAGDLAQAREFNDRLAEVAVSTSIRSLHRYTEGEIASVQRRYELAEEHYREAIALARSARATFIEGIASVGLVSVHAAAGRRQEALCGYRELVGYWQRTGMWLQQWTTLRNLAGLLHAAGDPEAALFLTAAADHAPDAPAVAEGVWPATPDSPPPLPRWR